MSTMTDHPDESLIHDFVDDELSGAERARVEAHLAACPSCRELADSLLRLRDDARRVFAGARAIEADQWGGIHARIETRARALSRGLSPLAAAAALALLIGSGAVLYTTLRGPEPEAPAPVVVATEQSPADGIAVAYRPALAELERMLEAERDLLQPETIATLEANLAILDAAIREIEAALAVDPGHRGNLRSLDGMYQTKLGVLQQVVTLTTGA